jgi:hypothetical protein
MRKVTFPSKKILSYLNLQSVYWIPFGQNTQCYYYKFCRIKGMGFLYLLFQGLFVVVGCYAINSFYDQFESGNSISQIRCIYPIT